MEPSLGPLEVSCQAVKEKLDGGEEFVLIDCREPVEHEHVNLEAAKLLPMSQMMERVSELEPHRSEQIVVHCHHGGRSLQVAQWLQQQGFADVKSMAGGIDRWAVEIDPSLPRY